MGDELEAIKANAEEFRARYEIVVEKFGAMQERVDKLTEEKILLEDMKDAMSKDLDDAQDACEEAEKERDQRTEEKDQAVEDLRDARRAMLEMLRRLQFTPSGPCPLCRGLVLHEIGCDLRLMMGQLDMDLIKPAYAMTAKK